MAHPDPPRPIRGFGTGGCYGSVLLDNELRHSLIAMNGHEVPWVHGCVLDHGHDGDHAAPTDHADGEPEQWLRWSHTGPARLERFELSPPGRHSTPQSPAPEAQTHQPGNVSSPAKRSQVEALWAIAAAIDRLADSIADLRNPSRGSGTQ